MIWLAFLVAIAAVIVVWAAQRNKIEWWATLITAAWIIQLIFVNLGKLKIE
jgi:hypothetical protein